MIRFGSFAFLDLDQCNFLYTLQQSDQEQFFQKIKTQ